MAREIPEIRVGDVVRMQKAHPCGGDQWIVTRSGADVGIRCSTCGRRVMLDRLVYERRVKLVVEQGPPTEIPSNRPSTGSTEATQGFVPPLTSSGDLGPPQESE